MMNKYKLINHKNSAFYGKPMYFENLADAKRELTRVGGQLYRLSDGTQTNNHPGQGRPYWRKIMNETITKAGQSVQQLRAALLGALTHADPITSILLRDLVADATRIEARLVQIDNAFVEAGRDDE